MNNTYLSSTSRQFEQESPLRDLSASITPSMLVIAQLQEGLASRALETLKAHPSLIENAQVRNAALDAIVQPGSSYVFDLLSQFKFRPQELTSEACQSIAGILRQDQSAVALAEGLRLEVFSQAEVDAIVEKVFSGLSEKKENYLKLLQLAPLHSDLPRFLEQASLKNMVIEIYAGFLINEMYSSKDSSKPGFLSRASKEVHQFFGITPEETAPFLADFIEQRLNEKKSFWLEAMGHLYPYKEGERRECLLPMVIEAIAGDLRMDSMGDGPAAADAWSLSTTERVMVVDACYQESNGPLWNASRLPKWICALKIDYENVRNTVERTVTASLGKGDFIIVLQYLKLPRGFFPVSSDIKEKLVNYFEEGLCRGRPYYASALVSLTSCLALTQGEQAQLLERLIAKATPARQIIVRDAAARLHYRE